MVVLEGAVVELVDRLTGREKQLEVISIVGMPGLGKTTLAKRVYNHPNVVYHFYIRAWTRVFQAYQKKDLLLGTSSSVIESEIREMSNGKLLELLKKQLLGQRYLIVMDDIWDDGAWNDLQRSFPDNKNGSKAMFTSRMTNAAVHAQLNSDPCYLRFLTDSESRELLCQKVFQTKHCPSELMEIGLQITKKCSGEFQPLTSALESMLPLSGGFPRRP
ncbi:hypothetical protein LguiA_013453 [Lonicera macranthoides]